MRAPLAIDLYCGLAQSKFCRRAYLLVEQLVTRRAKYPNHMALAVGHHPPSTVAFMSGTMRDLKHPSFATSLAGLWKIRIFAAQSLKRTVPIWTPRIVNFLDAGLPFVKCLALHFRGCRGAIGRAIALIAVWRRYVEARTAYPAITSGYRNVGLLPSPPTSRACLTSERAIAFIRPLRLKLCAAIDAKQVVHAGYMP